MNSLVFFIIFNLLSGETSGYSVPVEDEIIRKSAQACKNFGTLPKRTSSRIVGGSLAEIDEFPHFASIGKRNGKDESIKFQCGGTLISEKFVLTAAHCKFEMCFKNVTDCVVRLGTNFVDDKNEDYSGVDFGVKVWMKFENNWKVFNEILNFRDS